jgi:hypothetical protein
VHFEGVSPSNEHRLPVPQCSAVQASPSSQSASAWQQFGIGVPAQVPAWQWSPPVQTSPSSHEPSRGENWQVPVAGSQESVVQSFASSHTVGVPAHVPSDAQASAVVQASWSSQTVPAGAGS